MLIAVLATGLGIALLTVAADQLVVGAARLAVVLRVSPVVIGAVLIGFGTSAPELVVSGAAARQGDLDLGVGNIIGSNLANLTLVLGVAALVVRMNVSSSTLRREAPLSTLAVVLFAVVVQGGLTRWDGVLLGVALVAVLGVILAGARAGAEGELVGEVREYVDGDSPVRASTETLRTVAGLVGTVAGAQLLVTGATGIADELSLSEGFIGLTLVAIGTSLPELVTAVAAARRGEDELVVGNLLGSNIFNSLAVGSAVALIGPGRLADPELTGLAVGVMVGVAIAAWAFMASGREVVRWEAALLLATWVVTLSILAA